MKHVHQTPTTRNRWGQPLIDGVAYKRASGLAVDDKSGLLRWAAGMAALGVARNDTIRNTILTLDDTDPKAYKKELYRLGEEAKEHAGGSKAASDGTSIHRVTEMLDHGQNITHLPTQLRDAAAAYQQLLHDHGLIPLAAEVFVACPALQVAGTLDRLVMRPDGTVAVLDLKTGGVDSARYAGLSWATQIAAYAHSDPYCADRGWLTWETVGLIEPTADVGLVAHVPQDDPTAACLWQVDLDAGWEAAKTAATVHTQRKTKYLTPVGGAGNTNKKKKEQAA